MSACLAVKGAGSSLSCVYMDLEGVFHMQLFFIVDSWFEGNDA